MPMKETEIRLHDLLGLITAAEVLADSVIQYSDFDRLEVRKVRALCHVIMAAVRDGSGLARQFEEEVALLNRGKPEAKAEALA